MRSLLSAEGYKLRKSGAFVLLCEFLAVSIVLYAVLAYWTNPKDGGGYRISMTAIELYGNAVMINQLLLKLFVGVLAGFFLSSEYAAGVLKRAVSLGHSRERVFTAKLGVYALGVVAAALLIPVLAAGIGSLMTGMGLLAGFGEREGVAMLAYVLRTLGFMMLFSAAYAAISAWIAVVLADSGKTIGVTIVFFLFVDQILMSLSNYVPLLKALYDYSLFKLFADSMSFQMSARTAALCIVVPVATTAVFALLGVHAFRRKEIQ